MTDRRHLVLTRASTITPRPTRWLWDGRIAAGTLALLAGPVDVGKSTLTVALAAQVTVGSLAGAFHGKPRSVIICATEDTWDRTIVPRLLVAGADLERVYRADVISAGVHMDLSLPGDIEQLGEAAVANDVALLVLDPLLSRLHHRLDSHRDAEVRRALEPLVRLADRSGAAVIGIMHFRKGAGDPLELVMASRAFTAVARAVLVVARDPDHPDRRYLGQPKNNLGPSDLPTLAYHIDTAVAAHGITAGRLVWDGEDSRHIAEILGTARRYGAVDAAADWLGQFLGNACDPVPSAQVKSAGADAGFSDALLRRAAHRAGVVIVSRGFPRTTVWMLSKSSGGAGVTQVMDARPYTE